jgi:hypothetical protein
MKRDIHEQARELIACSGTGNDKTTSWLRQHLLDCAECREYAESAAHLGNALHSIVFAAGTDLVRATQIRVRSRAEQLRLQKERMHLVWLSCSLLVLSGAATTPLVWQVFHWVGEAAHVPGLVWQVGFAVFSIAPALVVSTVLIARGIHSRAMFGNFTDQQR